ncbi:MAG: hypothetical protein ACYSW8_32960, partial [Planctomycetota bacterium]
MKFLGVKNWDHFQHYKTGKNADGQPRWIRMHVQLLEDYDFNALSETSQLHLMKIWALASRVDNKIPFDNQWVKTRIDAKSKVDLKTLIDTGFLEILGESYDDPRNVLGQKRREEKRVEEEEDYKSVIDLSKVKSAWNEKVANGNTIARCRVMSEDMKRSIIARAREHGEQAVWDALDYVAKSDFFQYKWTASGKCSIGWVFGPKNFPKVVNG